MTHLTSSWRKLILSIHIGATVSVLGADLVLLALGIWGLLGAAPVAVYPAAHLVGSWLVAPLAITSLATGVLLGLLTPWGLFRYWWVTIKLAVTAALSAVVLLVLVPRLGESAAAAVASELAPIPRLPLVVGPGVATSLLALSLLLAVFKPGWRLRADR